MTDKLKFDLYNDVVTNDVYEVLTRELTDEEKEGLDTVLRQFTTLLENGLIRPGYNLMERARDEMAQDMIDEVVEELERERQAAGGDGTDPDTEVPAACEISKEEGQ